MKPLTKQIPVDFDVLDALVQYLISRPMSEVEVHVQRLRLAAMTAQKAAAEKPEEAVDG